MKIAFGQRAASADLDIKEQTFEEFVDILRIPRIGKKDGKYFLIGGDLIEPKRKSVNLRSAEFVVIDCDSSVDTKTDLPIKNYTRYNDTKGCEEPTGSAPPFEGVVDVIDRLGVNYVAYSSHSHRPGGPFKYRIVICCPTRNRQELIMCTAHFVWLINDAGYPLYNSSENNDWIHLWYMPSVPLGFSASDYLFKCRIDGVAFDVSKIKPVLKLVPTVEPRPSNVVGMTIEQAAIALNMIESRLGGKFADRRDWLDVSMAIHHEFGGSAEVYNMWDDWCAGIEGYDRYKNKASWDSFDSSREGGITMASILFKYPHVGVWWRGANEGMARRLPTDTLKITDDDDDAIAVGEGSGFGGSLVPGGDDELITSGRNEVPVANAYNSRVILRSSPEWIGVLVYNEFTQRTLVLKPIPGVDEAADHFPRDLVDNDFTAAVCWFNLRDGFAKVTKGVIIDALEQEAFSNVVHPVRSYLGGLVWDGVPRISTWLEAYSGAVGDADYISNVGRCWMVGAVARVMRPGCQVDNMMVLEGAQGIGKSSAMRILCGKEAFGDALPHVTGSTHAADYVRGKWIIEVAEMAAARKADAENMKAFISRVEEKFRPAYGRKEISYLRQCVFVGTTNDYEYLKDETGNRRYWPVRVGKIDGVGLARDRDMLWAEAVMMYHRGDKWWFDSAVAVAEQKSRLKRTWVVEVLTEALENETAPFWREMILEEDIREVLKEESPWYVPKGQIERFMKEAGFVKRDMKSGTLKDRFARKIWTRPRFMPEATVGELAAAYTKTFPDVKFR